MQLLRGLRNLRLQDRRSAVTIGTFDGLHLGHQALIDKVTAEGRRLNCRSVLLTFEPMPREFLHPQDPPARLTSLRERWRILGRTPLDELALLPFDAHLRSLSAEAFVTLLAGSLAAQLVVVGHDFRYGRGGEATASMLASAGAELGFEVEVIQPVCVAGERVSSSGVRAALARGDFSQAQRWLGRPYSMLGRVIAGEQLGRRLGYPTANLRLERRRAALQGIFAVRVHGIAEQGLPGVASLGTRPAVGGGRALLEAHVFEFAQDLYGCEIEVEFVAKLRDERHFATLDALVAQMDIDAAEARRILT